MLRTKQEPGVLDQAGTWMVAIALAMATMLVPLGQTARAELPAEIAGVLGDRVGGLPPHRLARALGKLRHLLYLQEPRVWTIAENGLGDADNDYAHSQIWHNGCLFVGGNRHWLTTLGAQLSQGEVGDLPTGEVARTRPWAEALAASIWRYCPRHEGDHEAEWEEVYRSEVVQDGDEWYPNEHSIREMIVFDGEIHAFSGLGLVPGRLIIKSATGDPGSWQHVPTPAAMGEDARAAVDHEGVLYVAPGNTPATVWRKNGDGSWSQVANFLPFGPGLNAITTALASFNGHVWAAALNPEGYTVFRSTERHPDANPQWRQIVAHGAGDQLNVIPGTFQVFKHRLYLGTINLPILAIQVLQEGGDILDALATLKACELIRIDRHDRVELVVGDRIPRRPAPGGPAVRHPISGIPAGFFNPLNFYVWSMGVGQDGDDHYGKHRFGGGEMDVRRDLGDHYGRYRYREGRDEYLLLGTFDASSFLLPVLEGLGVPNDVVERLPIGADLWKSRDGRHWYPIDVKGVSKQTNYGIRDITPLHDGGKHALGYANPFEGFGVDILLKGHKRHHDGD